MNEYNKKEDSFHSNLCGAYKVQVVNPQNEVVVDSGWNKNIILNQGMDAIATNTFADLTKYAIAGTGSRANKILSGLSTITQAASTITLVPDAGGLLNFSSSVTASAPYEVYYSHSLQPGDVIIDSDNSQSNVIAIDTSAGLTASVDTSYTIGSGKTFTIWKTSQIGMHKEIKRSGTSIAGTSYVTGECGTAYYTGSNGFPNVQINTRAYNFISESTDKLYTEIGTGWIITGATSVFSRVVLPTPLAVSSSFQLRVIYALQVTFTPETPRGLLSASISGWPVAPATNTNASESLQKYMASSVQFSGASINTSPCFDPSGTGVGAFEVFISPVSTSLAAFGSAVSRATNVTVADTTSTLTYFTGSYTLYKICQFGLNSANATNHASIGFGYYDVSGGIHGYSANNQAYCMVFAQTQSKSNIQLLNFAWKWTWERTLSGT